MKNRDIFFKNKLRHVSCKENADVYNVYIFVAPCFICNSSLLSSRKLLDDTIRYDGMLFYMPRSLEETTVVKSYRRIVALLRNGYF